MSVNYPTLSLPLLIGEVVTTVETEMLTTLQTYDSVITNVNYEYGSWKEITQTLQEKKANATQRPLQFPVIMLIEDISIQRGQPNQLYGTAQNVNIIIANWTKDSYKSSQRETINFQNILRPLYRSFLKNLVAHRGVQIYHERNVQHTMTERKYWGMEQHTVNALGYFIDAIDITGLQIPLDWTYCNNIINANIT